jgi:hypothetical protein
VNVRNLVRGRDEGKGGVQQASDAHVLLQTMGYLFL